MKNQVNMFIIDYLFSDGTRMKYVVQRNKYYEAKNEAEEAMSSWNSNPVQGIRIKEYNIREIKGEDNKPRKSSDNPRHTSKSKVRKHDIDEDEEYS